jgi:hypothetical protein
MVLERFFNQSPPKFRLRFSFTSKKEKVEPKERRRKSFIKALNKNLNIIMLSFLTVSFASLISIIG